MSGLPVLKERTQLAKTTVKFSVTNYSKVTLDLLQIDGKPAVLDLYGSFHDMPATIAAEESYTFDLQASARAIGGFVYSNYDKPSELFVLMACAAKQDGIDNAMKFVSTLSNVVVSAVMTTGEFDPVCTITLKDK